MCMPRNVSVIFKVRASQDVRVGLFAGAPNSDQMYEFVIGGENNSKTYIQNKDVGKTDNHRHTGINNVTETIGILNFNEERKFWADFLHTRTGCAWLNCGWVRLGKGDVIGSNIIVQFKDEGPMGPTHVGYRSGSEAFWTLTCYSNCNGAYSYQANVFATIGLVFLFYLIN